jgi:hypothetical protein
MRKFSIGELYRRNEVFGGIGKLCFRSLLEVRLTERIFYKKLPGLIGLE